MEMTARTEARNVLLLICAVVALLFAVGAGPGSRGMMFTVLAGVLLSEIDWKNWRDDQ
jgi:hypothetical protein